HSYLFPEDYTYLIRHQLNCGEIDYIEKMISCGGDISKIESDDISDYIDGWVDDEDMADTITYFQSLGFIIDKSNIEYFIGYLPELFEGIDISSAKIDEFLRMKTDSKSLKKLLSHGFEISEQILIKLLSGRGI